MRFLSRRWLRSAICSTVTLVPATSTLTIAWPDTPNTSTDDIADLDVGRLQHFLDAVFLRRKIALQLLAPPRQVSQFDLCARRQKASFQQSMPVQMGQILRIPEVGLISAFRLLFTRADQYDLHARFENVLDRNPVRARALHRHAGAACLSQPVSELLQLRHCRAERPRLHLAVLVGRTRNDSDCYLSLADVDSGAPLDYRWDLYHSFSLLVANRAAGVSIYTLPLGP